MISSSLIAKWKRMMKGESVFHVNQTEGQCYSSSEVKGYYNNLTDKVRYTKNLDEKGVPFNIAARGEEKRQIYFPITVFQYGLGAYDLWLMENEKEYLDKALIMANWAVENQGENGSWDAFGPLNYHCKYSSMAQGEGASLLARAYVITSDEKYKKACEKAIDYMLLPLDQGGTAIWMEKGLKLLEYPEKATVLNGWMFSAFGLFDCWKITGDEKYRQAWEKAVEGIVGELALFDAGHWSYYDDGGKYTSPFYHRLHIELLKACNKLAPRKEFDQYISKWSRCRDSKIWSKIAFAMKAKQKVFEKKSQEWVLAE